MNSKNPILNESSFEKMSRTNTFDAYERMTVDGAVNKSFLLFGLMMITTVISFGMPSAFLMWTGVIGGIVALIAGYWKPQIAHIAAPG